jgi:DNA-binding MarR family transcriptional regulator
MNHTPSMVSIESSGDHPDNQSSEISESVADEGLKLENQVCFPLYAASRLMMQLYKPHLDRLGLTYPQYLVMMVLWSQNALSVRQIGELLYLDSATLTQVLGNLEKSELITRERVKGDARTVINKLTTKGRALKKRARRIPQEMSCEFADRIQEVAALRPLLRNLVTLLADRVNKS